MSIIIKKPIPGFENLYEAHSNGCIWSLKSNKYLKGLNPQSGYYRVNLHKNGTRFNLRFVHRLVALAFLGPISNNKYQCNHINGNKLDNRPENLEYVTRSENTLHSYKLKLQIKQGIKHHLAKLNDEDVHLIRDLAPILTTREIAQYFSVSLSTLNDVIKRRTWIHI